MFWSQHIDCWGENTSRIQNKEVYATLYLQAEGNEQMTQVRVLIADNNIQLQYAFLNDPALLGSGLPGRRTWWCGFSGVVSVVTKGVVAVV